MKNYSGENTFCLQQGFVFLILLVAMLLFSGMIPVVGQSDLCLYASFDSLPHADLAGGDKASIAVGISYTEGRHGKAVVISQGPESRGTANSLVNFSSRDNLFHQEGSLEMWVKPVDWGGDDDCDLIFFDNVIGEQDTEGIIRLAKVNTSLQFFYGKLHGNMVTAVADVNAWKSGEWYHVAATWQKGGSAKLYIDGELKANLTIPGRLIPGGLEPRFRIGSHYLFCPVRKHTAIDELYIYKRSLNAEEIRNAHKRDVPLSEKNARYFAVPSFALDFEEGYDGMTPFSSPIKAGLTGNPELVSGRFGQAMKSGTDGFLSFPADGVLYPDRGTVEFWLSPVDWDGNDRQFHTFFETRGHEGVVQIFKDSNANLVFEIGRGKTPLHESAFFSLKGIDQREWWDTPTEADVVPINVWGPGRWHHIACVWSPSRQYLYIDGKCVSGKLLMEIPASLGTTFHLGDLSKNLSRSTLSLIDRVYIYDRPLTEKQIQAHFAGDYRKKFKFSEEHFRLDYKIDRERNQFLGIFEVWGIEDADLSADFTVTEASSLLLKEAGTVTARRSAVAFFGAKATMNLLLSDLPAGNYQLEARVTHRNGESAKQVLWFDIIPDESKNNTIGKEEEVLPPWTPMEYGVDSVACWGREYKFHDKVFLPSQIISAGKEILARPMNLLVRVDGKPLKWENNDLKFALATPAKAEIDIEAQAITSSGTVNLKTQMVAEFDGLLVITIKLAFSDENQPDSIALEIPCIPGMLYRSRFVDSTYLKGAGSLSENTGLIDSDRFIPYVWLGDNDRGLFWFCESSLNWPNKNSNNAFEIVRKETEIRMRFHLLDKGQKIQKDWSFQFGLQATPVKPLPMDWRKWRRPPCSVAGPSTLANCNFELIWPNRASKDSFKHFGSAGAVDPEEFSRRIEKMQQRGLKAVPYINLNNLSSDSAAFHWYGRDWTAYGNSIVNYGQGYHNMAYTSICPASRGYVDVRLWENVEFVKQFNLDGFYHDNVFVISCNKSSQHGHPANFWPVLATRELYKRHYAAIKSLGGEKIVIMHTAPRIIPILAYADIVLDGERYAFVLEDHYPDVLPLDVFRAAFMGRQWGYIPMFLPEFKAPFKSFQFLKQLEPSRGLMAMLMLHDVLPWIQFCNSLPIIDALDALDEFGFINAEFIPYFADISPAVTDMEKVHVSIYRKEGEVLAVIANLSREDASGTIQFNENRLGITFESMVSWPDRTSLDYHGRELYLEVPRQGYRMVLISGKTKKE